MVGGMDLGDWYWLVGLECGGVVDGEGGLVVELKLG